ncbi:MAG: nuclear transport factor 2 family protein [Gemmatimonadales bacterium]
MHRQIGVLATLSLAFTLAGPRTLAAQMPAADSADVRSIEAIVSAYYDVISGPPGAPRQWRRDSTLYMPTATFVAMDVRNGTPVASIMTPEEFRRGTNASFVKNGFFETEIGSRIERFGNVAQVRSAYETRDIAGGPVSGRGVNYLMLYWDGKRWWIAGAVWDDERPGTVLPQGWVGNFERDGQ